jgi:hypothetical protein
MYGVDFAFRDRGDGTSDVVWALPRHRATWLSFLAATYSYLTVAAASIIDPHEPGITQLHDAMRGLVEDPELRRACNGDYDQEADDPPAAGGPT